MPVKPLPWKRRFLGIAFFFLLITPSLSAEEKKSKFALGVGAGWLHDYPGANQGRIRFLPFPIYRGKFFRMDRVSGVSGHVFDNSRLNFSWNFIFQFPTDSENIPARKGMPNLDWLLSLGPQLKYTLLQTSHHKTYFRFPVRINTCTNFSNRTRFCGISFNPGIRHSLRFTSLGEFTFRAELYAHSTEYSQYFYEVHPRYATPTRASYHAQAGYLGSVFGFFHSFPLRGWQIVSSFNVYDYNFNVNEDSPLFLQKTNYSVFFATTIDF
ncbi:MAG: MipA/OmpV family protein [Bdellovibrionales bacterium]|nr:MipA/OmpV family protein [Bdellovibrionales bacterium]